MIVILTYDVNTTSSEGNSRLHRVAKVCESYGVRVQNSVFELLIDSSQLILIKNKLQKIIDKDIDSVRFYLLGNKWEKKIETLGRATTIKYNDTLIL
jgi:CRISPR-associated protein Cas2